METVVTVLSVLIDVKAVWLQLSVQNAKRDIGGQLVNMTAH